MDGGIKENPSRTPLSRNTLLFSGGDALKTENEAAFWDIGHAYHTVVVLAKQPLEYANGGGLAATIRMDESSLALIDPAILIRWEK